MQEENYFEVVVPSHQGKQRLDKFLAQQIASVSRARLQKLIQEELVRVNGQPAKASHLVLPGEKVEVCVPKPTPVDILPENIPLNIVYEDVHLLVLNKAAGMVVHPAFGNYSGTLVNALLYYCGDLSSVGGRKRPGIVHRLDKDTSGLMVVAKNDAAHQSLSNQFKQRETEREYQAICWGRFKKRKGKIETFIARSPKDRKRMTVQLSGRLAITNYDVLETHWVHSLVKLNLETGRTHQIRVHLSYLGHPVFGDAEYGGRNRQLGNLANDERQFAGELLLRMDRQSLHAKVIGFTHPAKNEFMRFDSELPEDMKLLLDSIRNQTE
ncbi:RluA family pseudouridine synthase [candidate division KSB1 bacterium]|nr:RluA family pseudouridine synthase [candidate division KSB1 bacterium]TDI93499.1 MAG: RluA family pseudouridine synthase [Caldithrix sp.]TDI93865.1 MAG: RluA family pseudouridine synthase [Caldithrix sp.]